MPVVRADGAVGSRCLLGSSRGGSLGCVTTDRGAWRAAAALGPYFAVDTVVDTVVDGPGWTDLRALVDDPVLLRDRVAVVRRVLAQRCNLAPEAIDLRATASIYFLGLAARLVSPAFGAAVLGGAVPGIAIEDVRWRAAAAGPIPIAVLRSDTHAADILDDLAGLLHDQVLSTTVLPVALAVQDAFHLSPQVLRGNVSSAVAGAATMAAAARPDLATRCTRLAGLVVSQGLLAGTGHYVPDGSGGLRFLRNNCCLFYRVPGGGTCADCVLGVKAAR